MSDLHSNHAPTRLAAKERAWADYERWLAAQERTKAALIGSNRLNRVDTPTVSHNTDPCHITPEEYENMLEHIKRHAILGAGGLVVGLLIIILIFK